MIKKKVLLLILLHWLCFLVTRVDAQKPRVVDVKEWLVSSQYNMFYTSLADPRICSEDKKIATWQFHRFAFEFRLNSKTTADESLLRWRYHIRHLLHTHAKSEPHFRDPGGIGNYFVNGYLSRPSDLPPIYGHEGDDINQATYQQMVEDFQLYFCDLATEFDTDASMTNDFAVVGTSNNDSIELARVVAGKKWLWLTKGKLPVHYQKNPFAAFMAFPAKVRLYYLPAFLRMCEADTSSVGDLPKLLLNHLCEDDVASAELRKSLTPRQKKIIAVFFEGLPGVNNNDLERLRSHLK